MPKLHNNQFRHIKKNSSNTQRQKPKCFQKKRQFMVKWRNRNVCRQTIFRPRLSCCQTFCLESLNIYKDYNVLKNYGEKLYRLLAGFREMDLRANLNTLQRRKFELELEVSEGGARLYSMQLHRPNFNFDFSPRFHL